MVRKGLTILLSVMALTAIMISGCGKSGGDTLATVGSDKITAENLNEIFSRIRLSFPTAQDEFNKRREMVDSLIVTRLLIQGAYEKGIDRVEELSRIIMGSRDKFLLDALYQKHIADKSEPQEAEIRDFYNHLEYKLRASHILVEDADTAQMIFDKVKAGEDFEQFAFDYSIDPQAKRNKGDLGFFVWGAMVDGFQEAVFAMEPGEISPPVQSRFGYHIIKLVDKMPNDQRVDFAQMKEPIREQVANRKRMALIEEYFEGVKARYPVTVDTATCDYLLKKREMMYPPQVLPSLPRNDFDDEQLDRNERELVIAHWDGGQLTVYEYLTLVRSLSANIRPDFDNYDSLAVIIFELKKPDILSLDALRDGLDQDQVFMDKMKMFKELNMADMMKNDSIPLPPSPDEGMIRQYYDEHLDEFTDPAKVHVYEILLSDEMKARKLAKEIKSLKAFKKKATELTERPGNRSKGGDLGFIRRDWYPEIYDLAIKTSVGAIGGPVVTSRKYSIFYVIDKIESQVKDFLGVKKPIIETLRHQQKNDAIQTWIDERLKSTSIDIDEEAIWATIKMDRYAAVDTLGQ